PARATSPAPWSTSTAAPISSGRGRSPRSRVQVGSNHDEIRETAIPHDGTAAAARARPGRGDAVLLGRRRAARAPHPALPGVRALHPLPEDDLSLLPVARPRRCARVGEGDALFVDDRDAAVPPVLGRPCPVPPGDGR